MTRKRGGYDREIEELMGEISSFQRTFSLCLGLMLKKIHWTIYSTAGLHCDLGTINSVSFPHIL